MDRWKKLAELDAGGLGLLLSSALLLPLINLLLLTIGYLHLRRLVETLAPLKPRTLPASADDLFAEAVETARLVSAAARYGPYRATCLRRALLIWACLRRKGLDSRICFGVRLVDGGLFAHAWVEWQGRVVNDDPDIRRQYTPIQEAFPQTQAGL